MTRPPAVVDYGGKCDGGDDRSPICERTRKPGTFSVGRRFRTMRLRRKEAGMENRSTTRQEIPWVWLSLRRPECLLRALAGWSHGGDCCRFDLVSDNCFSSIGFRRLMILPRKLTSGESLGQIYSALVSLTALERRGGPRIERTAD